MLRRIHTADADASDQIANLCNRGTALDPSVVATTQEIITDVRLHGDTALATYTQRFDGRAPNANGSYEIEKAAWQTAAETLAPELRNALKRAAQRIKEYHQRQMQTGFAVEEEGFASHPELLLCDVSASTSLAEQRYIPPPY